VSIVVYVVLYVIVSVIIGDLHRRRRHHGALSRQLFTIFRNASAGGGRSRASHDEVI